MICPGTHKKEGCSKKSSKVHPVLAPCVDKFWKLIAEPSLNSMFHVHFINLVNKFHTCCELSACVETQATRPPHANAQSQKREGGFRSQIQSLTPCDC